MYGFSICELQVHDNSISHLKVQKTLEGEEATLPVQECLELHFHHFHQPSVLVPRKLKKEKSSLIL